MANTVSAREVRSNASDVLRRVERGERLTVTVDRRPVAELVPLHRRRLVPAADAFAVVRRAPADRALLAALRGAVPDTTDVV